MKKETKQLLHRIAAVTAAISITIGAACYGAQKLPTTVPASTDGSEPRVIILDAGHGECA